jgi:hypothetical protein
MTNVGNAYDSRDGQLTAPVDGLCMIYAKICSQQSFSVHIEIVRNGAQLCILLINSMLLLSIQPKLSLQYKIIYSANIKKN